LVLLAGMKQISAEMGQVVRVGEPIGTMGDGPSTLALLGDEKDRSHPVFYVEFRKDNAPVDSTPWWATGRKEAMK
jgi:septal ring factor EnvC (AmiA/AmiB activator)